MFSVVDVVAQAMLLARAPPPFVLSTISPVVQSVTLFLIVQVLTVVSNAICVYVDSMPLHVVVRPLAVVSPAVFPKVGTLAIDFIIKPLAIVS